MGKQRKQKQSFRKKRLSVLVSKVTQWLCNYTKNQPTKATKNPIVKLHSLSYKIKILLRWENLTRYFQFGPPQKNLFKPFGLVIWFGLLRMESNWKHHLRFSHIYKLNVLNVFKHFKVRTPSNRRYLAYIMATKR